MATGAAIGGAALAGGGQIFGGIQARNAAKGQATQLRNQAELEREAAEFRAIQQERNFDKLIGSQRASIASSGIRFEGSPLLLIEESLRDKKETIENIIKFGEAKAGALSSQARNVERQGRNALIGSVFGALGTGLQAGSNFKQTS